MEDFMKERGIADEVIKRFIKEKVIKFLNCSKTFHLGKGTFTCKKTHQKPKCSVLKKNSFEDEVSNHRIYHS